MEDWKRRLLIESYRRINRNERRWAWWKSLSHEIREKSCCIHARKLCSSEYIYTADTIFRHVFYNTVRVHVAHRIPFTFYNSVSFFYRRDPLSPIFWIDCDRYRVCAVRSLFLATTLKIFKNLWCWRRNFLKEKRILFRRKLITEWDVSLC